MSSDQSSNNQSDASPALLRTPLYDLHIELGAKMVPFAGYDMPVQYPMGILKEHLWTRQKAGLFDVSHMGQCLLTGPDEVAAQIERMVPADIRALKDGRMRYSQLLNDEGGIRDDLMISRIGFDKGSEWYFLVVNGACKTADFAYIRQTIEPQFNLQILDHQALLALQGPAAAGVLEKLLPGAADMAFMSIRRFADTSFGDVWVSRSGYTGEDGFELSVAGDQAAALSRALLADEDVEMIGLGARDSLRLEAGLCLYGHDLDETTSPVEGNLVWSIQKRRRDEGGFPGAARILKELKDGPARLLVGIRPEGRAPAREGAAILDTDGNEIGVVTSGGFGPTVQGPVAMGYVAAANSTPGTKIGLVVRGKSMPASVVKLPFVPHNYHRKAKA